MSCGDAVKREIQLSNFGLGYPTPAKFVTPRCGPRVLFFVWTGASALYHLVMLFLEIYWVYNRNGRHDLTWLLFLTNWSYMLLTFTVLWDLACVIHVHLRRPDLLEEQLQHETLRTPWYLKINWLLFTTNSTAALMVTVVFWALLVDPERHKTFSSFNKHAINLVYAFPNVLFSAKPFRLYHVYMPFLYFGMYIAFSGIHFAATGSYVYTILDWNDPPSAIKNVFPLLFIGVPVAHIFLFIFAKLSCYIISKCCKKEQHRGVENGIV